MKIVAAPNALKGTLSADAAAEAIALGIKRTGYDAYTVRCPIADGGDGTIEILVRATDGRFESALVHDALGRPIEASYGFLGDGRAVLDVASASGLARLRPDELDLLSATSFGTGELVLAALRNGAREIVLGVGGSATVDGGLGLLRALGVKALDAAGNELPNGARALGELARFDLSGLVPEARAASWTIVADVDAYLGGALAFARQKGARSQDLPGLVRGLDRFEQVLGERANFAGAGAAGGIPAALVALLGARVVSGCDFVLDVVGFDRAVAGASLVVTAEGQFDAQSSMNKGTVVVARRAEAFGVPAVILAGSVRTRPPWRYPVLSITREPCDLESARRSAYEWLALTAEQMLHVFILGMSAARPEK